MMQGEISIYRTVQPFGISDKKIRSIVERVFTHEKKQGSISIHCIGEHRMQSLNSAYRGKEYVTDVLTFSTEGIVFPGDHTDYGDIFLCPKYIKRQANDVGVSFEEEWTRMLIHGVLHAFGYDHEKKQDAEIMFPLQEKLLTATV